MTPKCSITTIEKNSKENSRQIIKVIEKELQQIHSSVKNLSVKELDEFIQARKHKINIPKETWLFHGTKRQNLAKIKVDGLKNMQVNGKDGIFFSPLIETASDYGNIIIVCKRDKINQPLYFDLDIYKWIHAKNIDKIRLKESLELMQMLVYNDFKL